MLPQLDDGAFTLAMRPGAPATSRSGVLHAEDVTRGMRAEVALDGGAFHPIGEGPVVTWEEAEGAGPRYGDHVRFAVRAVDLAGNVMHGSEQVVSSRSLPPTVRGRRAVDRRHGRGRGARRRRAQRR